MYESFFGLTLEPFSVAPDPRFLYMSEQHRQAFAHLQHGLRHAGGFVLLTGEIGAGKTTVWRCFLEQLPWQFDVAYVVNPKLGVDALLARICEDLRVKTPEGASGNDPIDAIHGHLLLAHAHGRRALIVVDEAQALSGEVMEQLRLLTNLVVSSDRKLVQVLLIGQPELRTMLERPALEPLAQRVVARFHLPALPPGETARYIAHRMTVAGLVGEVPFDADAIVRIHGVCRGVPRRINVLCDRALVIAHASGSQRIDRAIVERAASEAFGNAPPAAPATPTTAPATAPMWRTWLAVVGVAAVALAAGVLLAPLLVPRFVASYAPARGLVASGTSSAPALPTPAGVASAPVVALAPAPVAAAAVQAQAPEMAFGPALSDEAQAWRALAGLWGVTLGAGDPCELALQQSLHCYRARGGLGPIRQLGRPGIVKLTDDRGRAAHVLLVGLTDSSAVLRVGKVDQTVPLSRLARAWRGDFATFWLAPAGFRDGDIVGATGALAPWLAQRLAAADGAGALPIAGQTLADRIFAFQLAHGLEPDGLAGPLTLMQINRASGIDEPRLQTPR